MPNPVFAAERADGLAEQVLSGCRATLTASASVCAPFHLGEAALARLRDSGRSTATAAELPHGLHYFESLLVTAGWKAAEAAHAEAVAAAAASPVVPLPAGWNRNDDFFDPLEVWLARGSPEQKPVNHEHACDDIVGHIVSNRPVGEDGADVDAALAADELPDKYHLRTRSVLYRIWDKDDLQERMDRVLAEMAEGKWFVSMECHFRGFDYVVAESDGSFKAVARNKDTAFLTKHLRAYRGKGSWEGRRVGRLLRNIVFSGMGLVKKPANPESVIFPASAGAKVYCPVTNASDEGTAMPETELQKLLDAARAEAEALKARLRDGDVKELTTAREKAEAEVAGLKAALADAVATKAAAAAELEASQKARAELDKSYADAKARLDAVEAERRSAARLAELKAALKVVDGDEKGATAASRINDSLATLPDAAFKANVEALALAAERDMMTKPPPTNNPQAGNTIFPHGKVTPVPAATSAPTGPKAAPLPNPVSSTADVRDLDTAQVTPEPSLGVEVDKGGDGVRRSIASMFGYEDEAK